MLLSTLAGLLLFPKENRPTVKTVSEFASYRTGKPAGSFVLCRQHFSNIFSTLCMLFQERFRLLGGKLNGFGRADFELPKG